MPFRATVSMPAAVIQQTRTQCLVGSLLASGIDGGDHLEAGGVGRLAVTLHHFVAHHLFHV